MQSILIVEPSEDLRTAFTQSLEKDYRIFCCADGNNGLMLLQEHRPDGLITNLSLYGMDGLFFLESAGSLLPGAIITLAASYPPYVYQRLKDLGVSYPILIPCTLHSVTHRIKDLLNQDGRAVSSYDAQELISGHLRRLGIPCISGYHMLRIGIPLFSQDRTQRMTKELYPAIMKLCNCGHWTQVESAIRDVIHAAWDSRDEAVWAEYFDTDVCPSNKVFIYRLSEFLPL